MSMLELLLFVAGLVLLVTGAESLVRGASRLAVVVGVSPLIIGLTVVAYGTSSPELAVSVQSAYNQQTGIALGNAVGSNIFNVLFILGLSAMITPLIVSSQLIRRDVPIMIGVSFLLLLLVLDGQLGRLDGLVLAGGAVAYTVWSIVQGRKENGKVELPAGGQPHATGIKEVGLQLGLILLGLSMLLLGSHWLVEGAIVLARVFGVNETVIGLTIVAAGTSLPEVATSVVASLRGERDIAVGNVVGSNIFNILAVLGLAAIVSSNGIPVPATTLWFDLPVMVGVALACLPVFFTGGQIARWEGILFFGYYAAFTAYLILHATDSAALSAYTWAMVGFVVPLTIITLIVSTLHFAYVKNNGRAVQGR